MKVWNPPNLCNTLIRLNLNTFCLHIIRIIFIYIKKIQQQHLSNSALYFKGRLMSQITVSSFDNNDLYSVFWLLTDFVCLLIHEFCLSLWKIARCSVILLLALLDILPPSIIARFKSGGYFYFSIFTLINWHLKLSEEECSLYPWQRINHTINQHVNEMLEFGIDLLGDILTVIIIAVH